MSPRIRLKVWLVETGIRQGTFADMIGVNYQVITNIITGRTRPTDATAAAIERETRGAVKAKEWKV